MADPIHNTSSNMPLNTPHIVPAEENPFVIVEDRPIVRMIAREIIENAALRAFDIIRQQAAEAAQARQQQEET